MAIRCEPKRSRRESRPAGPFLLSMDSALKRVRLPFRKAVRAQEVTFFLSQLSLMIEVGTSLSVALKAIAQQTINPVFRDILRSLHRDVEEGKQFSSAMRSHPKVFDEVFVSMVKAGETGGFLKKILDQMVEMQEKRQALIAQVRTTLTYPTVLCVVAFLVVTFILVGVLPKFTTFFEGKESILPFTTRFLMFLSKSLREYAWAHLLVLAATAGCLKVFLDSEAGRALIDQLSVRGPIIGKIHNKISTCQLLRTLGNLMESRVPLLEALEVNRPTVRNRYFRQYLDKIAENIRQGGDFSKPFASNPYILPSVKQMVATGEEVGNLPKVMLRLAEFYDTEVDRELKTLASLIEPLALIVLGVVVGLIVSSVILPMFKLSQVIQ